MSVPAGRVVVALLVLLGWPGLSGPAVPPVFGSASSSAFEAEIQAFEAADAASPPPRDGVLFLGSSTFTRWSALATDFPGFTVLNRGFGGSQFGDVLHYFDRVVAVYRPALVVVYEGDNDLAGGRSVDQVFADWTQFVGRVESELPSTGVLFVSVKPSPSRRGNLEAQRSLNERIAVDCAVRPGCGFVDVAKTMLDGRGEPLPELFVSDQLHMNELGYARWRDVLGLELEAWAVAQPERSIRAPLGRVLVDFGGAQWTSADAGPAGGGDHWNNITAAVGASNLGRLSNLVTSEGASTPAAWVMTSRFNGVNQNGTTAPAPVPSSASKDSLFGNTEVFSGLANVTPAFRITGLRSGVPHHLTFYASRTGVGDNRETRYTVTGASVGFADLDVANNVSRTARVTGIQPDSEGVLAIALSPGPRNNNANHFVYLGAMILEEAIPAGRVYRFDVGGADSLTAGGAVPNPPRWNDVPAAVGTDPSGRVLELVDVAGNSTGIGLHMVAEFRAEDLSGTAGSRVFPATATRDSLIGHGAAWNGRGSTVPAFRLSGLSPNRVYTLGFFASCQDPGHRRETRYVVGGDTIREREAILDATANTNRIAWVTGVAPDASGAIQVRLLPGPANDSEGRITHLGVLALEWRIPDVPPAPSVKILGPVGGQVRLRVATAKGRGCRVERSADLVTWADEGWVRPGEAGMELSRSTGEALTFYRLVDAMASDP